MITLYTESGKNFEVNFNYEVTYEALKAELVSRGVGEDETIFIDTNDRLEKLILGNTLDEKSLEELISILEGSDYQPDAAYFYIKDNGSWDAEHFRDSYVGEYESFLDYAEEIFHITYIVDKEIWPYIDYEAYAEDLSNEGYWEEEGHVFAPA